MTVMLRADNCRNDSLGVAVDIASVVVAPVLLVPHS